MRPQRARVLVVVVIAAVTMVVSASCSSSTDSPLSRVSTAGPVSSASTPVAGDDYTCSDAAVAPVVVAALSPDESLRQLNGLQCLDGWAVVFPTVGPADGSAEGEIDITLVLKTEKGAWVNQDRLAVCGTSPTAGGSPAYPSDAQVPEGIWLPACQTN
jgi:hypothetical protein